MVATLTPVQNPATGTRVDIVGAGFSTKSWVSLVLGGMGTTTKVGVRKDGTFSVGVPIPLTLADGTHKLEARKTGTTTVLASVNIILKRTVTPPPPPPPNTIGPFNGFGSLVTGGANATPTNTGANVKWDVNEYVTGWVEYGLTSALGQSTPKELSFNYKSHEQNITGFTSGQKIFFRVTGKDSRGESYASTTSSFTTTGVIVIPPVDPPPPPVPSDYDAIYTATAATDQTLALKTFIESNRGKHIAISGVVPVKQVNISQFSSAGPVTTIDWLAGAKLKCVATDFPRILYFNNAFDIVLNDPRIEGTGFQWDNDNGTAETEEGISIYSGGRITINRPYVYNTRGDALYVGIDRDTQTPATAIVVNQPTFFRNSRNGITPNAGELTVYGGTIDESGLHNVDSEPNTDHGARSIAFKMDGTRLTRAQSLCVHNSGETGCITGYALAGLGYSSAQKRFFDIRNCSADKFKVIIDRAASCTFINNTSDTAINGLTGGAAIIWGMGSLTMSNNKNMVINTSYDPRS